MSDSQVDLMRALHDEHAASLWGYCLRLTGGDRARAEDVVQETLLRAWRHPAVLDQSQRSVRSWLFTVARNVVIDDWRTRALAARARPSRSCPRTPSGTRPTQLLQTWMVADALSQLSEDHRRSWSSATTAAASVADAAQRLGIPAGTVKSRTHYALRALRLALEEMGVQS